MSLTTIAICSALLFIFACIFSRVVNAKQSPGPYDRSDRVSMYFIALENIWLIPTLISLCVYLAWFRC